MAKIKVTDRQAQILSSFTQGKKPDASAKQGKKKANAAKIKGQKKEA